MYDVFQVRNRNENGIKKSFGHSKKSTKENSKMNKFVDSW